MILLQDTRQQYGKHINIEDYCKRNRIKLINQCLSVGDYVLTDGEKNDDGKYIPTGTVTVDTKADCMELLKDVMSNDHRRFRRECQRAVELGLQLIVLIEEEVPYGMVEYWEVPRWQSSNRFHMKGQPMSRIDPKVFAKALRTMTEKYGVQFRFCSRENCPSSMIKYLTGEFK